MSPLHFRLISASLNASANLHHIESVLYSPTQPHIYTRSILLPRDAGSEAGKALWATGLGLVCAGVAVALFANVCLRRRGITLRHLIHTLRRSLTRSPETETSTITEPKPEPKPCTLDLAAVVAKPIVPACPGPRPRCGETPHELRLTDDTLAVQGNGTCSTTQGDRSAACPRPLCRAPSIASCISEASCQQDLEPAEPRSATLSTEGLPHSDDPFASWHDPEPYEELPESRPASTSVRASVTPSTSGSMNGLDDSGYLSDGTVSTVPPSYRTYRPSIPNLLDHPLPLRPLPSLPSEVAVPPSAYPGTRRLRVVNGPGLPSTPRSSLAVQRSLTDLHGIQRQKTRNGPPRKSVDGGVRLDGLELPPAYGDPEVGSSTS